MALESICLSWVESFGGVFQSGFCALRLFQQPAKGKNGTPTETIENKGESHALALNGTVRQEKEAGSKGRPRTYTRSVNSRLLYH